MAFAADGGDTAAGVVVLEITDASSSFAAGGDAPSSFPSRPVSVSDLASLGPHPSPTVAVRADRHRQAPDPSRLH